MKPSTIRWLDINLGKPFCFILTLFYKLKLLVTFNRRIFFDTKRVVFIKLIEQGATVLAYSAIKNAVTRLGKENVFFIVFDNNKEILKILKIIPENNIISIRQKNIFLFIIDIIKAVFFLRKQKIDTTIDMEFFTRFPVILATLIGARKRIGLHKFTQEGPYRGDLLTHPVIYNPYLHVSESYYLLTECMFVKNLDLPLLKQEKNNYKIEVFKYIPEEKEKERAFEILGLSKKEKKIVLLNPNASDLLPIRKWDKKNFIILARMLFDEYKDKILIYITGAPSEKEEAEKIKEEINNTSCFSIAGKTTLRELITVYTISDLLITNDSGPGLFSSMTDINSIVLFGPETPLLFGSLSKKCRIVYKSLTCSPCVNVYNHRFSPCKNNICMQLITPVEVFKIAKEILDGKI